MGVFTKPIIYIGKEFRNEKEALVYFLSQLKKTLSEDDLIELDIDNKKLQLTYWLEDNREKGYPNCGLYSIFSGDENQGYYIGFPVYDKDPQKMKQKITQATESWNALFKDESILIQSILYY